LVKIGRNYCHKEVARFLRHSVSRHREHSDDDGDD